MPRPNGTQFETSEFSISLIHCCLLVLWQGVILTRTIITKTLSSFIGLLSEFGGIELTQRFAIS